MRALRCPFPLYCFEITTRTINRKFLMRPGQDINSIIMGVIARAQALTGVRIHGFHFASNHYHLLITVRNTRQKSKFMRLVNGNLSKKLNHLHGRRGTMWHRRFRAIGVAPDEETQTARLRYIMAHGVKEDLVDKVGDWPGATALPWLLRGEPIYGVWTDFTARYNASRRKGYVEIPGEFDTVYELRMTVLPCWAGEKDEVWRKHVSDLACEIDATAAQRRKETGAGVLGVAAILAADVATELPVQRRNPAPTVHAVCPVVRKRLEEGLRAIAEAYADASARFRDGEWDVEFPEGTFRPLGGFVTPMGDVEFGMW
ncbi:MAG: transposase [Myxococcales bacterium]|nr:transposase [Myxococcales bacterium]